MQPCSMTATGELRIGSAGWSLSSRQAPLFPAEGTHLQRYSGCFSAVEINSSFYRPHQAKTYANWAEQVPEDFRFAVKFPRSVTHDARLHEPNAEIDAFASQVAGLGDRLGPVLVQLPPSLVFDADVARVFFDALRTRLDATVVCEPRHPTWFTADVDAFWQATGVSRVAADPARVPEAAIAGGAGPMRYWRLHGSPRVYYDAYGEAGLEPWASQIQASLDAGLECWVILDNTTLGHATLDALRLSAMLEGGPPVP